MPSRDKLLEVIAIQTEVARQGLDLGGLMALVAQRTLALVDASGAAVEMAEGEDMVYRATAGMAEGSLGLRLQRGSSLSGLCVAQGRALQSHDAFSDPRADRLACMSLGLRSMVVVPLRHHAETVGVLKAMSPHAAHFNGRHVALLELLSDLVGAAMYFATRHAPGELFHKATHDGLTDLPNRSLFLDRLRSALAQSTRDEQGLAVLMLDLDGLKAINDSHGHRVGDAALTEFARRLRRCVRQSDTAARLGGDEFAVLLRPLHVDGGLEAMTQRLADALNGGFRHEQLELALSASLGCAVYPEDGADAVRLMDLADQRMYRRKRAAREAAT